MPLFFINRINMLSLFLSVLLTALSHGCIEDQPPRIDTESRSKNLRILFKWPGDDMATRQELEIRDRIVRHIEQRGLGKLIRMGTGMGWMDLVLVLEDREDARRNIEHVVRELSPDSVMSVQVEENSDG